jgi:hypothetical protein
MQVALDERTRAPWQITKSRFVLIRDTSIKVAEVVGDGGAKEEND